MLFLDFGDAFGRADQVEAADVLAAAFFEDVDGGDERTARGQHGVQDDGQAAFDIAGQLGIILHRLQRFLIAVQAHHADLGAGDHVQYTVHKAQAGTQDGDDGHHLAGNDLHFHGPGPALHRMLLGSEALGGLIDEQTGNLVGNTAEFAGGRTVLAQDAELVTHQGMIHYMDCHIQLLAVNEKSSGQSTLCCPLYAVKAPHRIDGKAPVYSVPALAYP